MGRRHLTCPRRSPRCLFCWARWLGLVPSFRARCRAAESLARPGTHWWGIPARAVTHAASWSGAAPRPAGYKNHFPQLPLPCPRPASLCASAVLLCAPCPVFKVRETERNRIGSALLLQPHRQSRRKHLFHFRFACVALSGLSGPIGPKEPQYDFESSFLFYIISFLHAKATMPHR